MLHRLRRVFARYLTTYLTLPLGAVSASGVRAEVWLRSGRVCLEGTGALEHGQARAEGVRPSLPYDPQSPVRVALRDRSCPPQVLPALPRWRLVLAQAVLCPRFLLCLLTVLPLLFSPGDPHRRCKALRRLRLAAEPPAPALQLTEPAGRIGMGQRPVSLVLPVHNARTHVAHCLTRIRTTTDLPWRLVIVDDGSTDPCLARRLADWVAREPRATLISHPAPRGFAGAVNAALTHLGDVSDPVILLNSDVSLPQGWASRLVAPILADGTVASVTPLSNEGELMGVPHACAGVALRNGEVDQIDAALAPFARATDLPMLPTGSGFCLALSPHWLADVPRFDESFGRGYGEEVDWCQRTRSLGGRHVCQTGLFVGHVGAASFGRATRKVLRAKAAPILSGRWPRFDCDVAQARERDPLVGERLRAGLLWARARLKGRPLPVYLAHNLGGGTARWLEQRLRSHEVAAVLRVGGAMRWQLELHSPEGVTRGASACFADIRTLLQQGGPREVIYTCAVGDPAPEEIPLRLLDLCAGGQRLEILFHDYFPLNRDYTFRSDPEAGWQALWRPALERAEHLTVFSKASQTLVAQAHPDFAGKIRVRPHAPLGPVPRLTAARSDRPVIGVPGHLNRHKGSAVVAELARVFDTTNEARLVVLGAVAPDCPLPRSVRSVGGYRLADLPHLVARHGIGLWLVPSLWAETFSYVTHEALATGLPVYGFDLGGQGDALRAQPNGHPVALHHDGGYDVTALLRALRRTPGWPQTCVKTAHRKRAPILRTQVGV